MSFSTLGLDPVLLRGIADLGFTQPTGIQHDAIPAALQGRDILACSNTGSGKTAAFGLPILQRLLPKNRRVTRALILTPTRELAAQIEDHLAALALHTKIKIASIYGGVSMGPQRRAFYDGVDIMVATPGRLLDHFQSDYARLDGLEVLVLDEADRMLDMGFLPDIRRILTQVPKKRQSLFFSATMPPQIVGLSREMLVDPVKVNLERKAAPAAGITHSVYPVPQHLKSQLLLKLLQDEAAAERPEVKSVLLFTRTKHRAERLASVISRAGIGCERIHGDRSQSQRTHALDGFKRGRFRVLVATDVAARGIDVDSLSHVVNFDVPGQPEDYIHRVGRTARAEATGDAFTFVSPEEEGGLRAIERSLGKKLPRVLLPDFDYRQAPKNDQAHGDYNRRQRYGKPGRSQGGFGGSGSSNRNENGRQGRWGGGGQRSWQPDRSNGNKVGGFGARKPDWKRRRDSSFAGAADDYRG